MFHFNVIFASDDKMGIGKDNSIPWHCKEDFKFFKDTTKGCAIIMGYKTWESLPKKPLPGRLNIVMSRSRDFTTTDTAKGVTTIFTSSMKTIRDACKGKKVFVIGGAQIYQLFLEKAINNPHQYQCDLIYHTQIVGDFMCDTFFPINLLENRAFLIEQPRELTESATIYTYEFRVEIDTNEEEKGYLDLLRDILENGEEKGDRTGTGTISVFGRQLRFSLTDPERPGAIVLPLLTSKRMFLRGIVEELLFFLRGDTNNDHLQEKNVHIWDGNTSREYLDSIGLTHYEEGTLGAAYGAQWRHWGAPYETKDTDYTGKGIDQLAEAVRLIREEPTSRRIIISGWNVSQLHEMALVPCHMVYQFNVNQKKGQLNCMMTQRSADTFLGVPFNIASTAIFTILMAKLTGYTPGEIVINFGDTHIYSNHLNQVERQLKREPYKFPTIEMEKDLNTIEDIEALAWEDFKLQDYNYHPGIKAKMAV